MFRMACSSYRYPYSSEALKETFINSLKDAKGMNNAIRFCNIILEAKRITNQTKSSPHDISPLQFCKDTVIKADKVIGELKHVISEDKPERNMVQWLVEMLTGLEKHPEKSKVLLRLLHRVDKSKYHIVKYNSSEKYLKHLIISTDYLINSFTKDSMYAGYHKKHSPNNLYAVQCALRENLVYMAEYLLGFVFQAGVSHQTFSEEEKKQIGTLMIEALEHIERCSWSSQYFNGSDTKILMLKKRSALQFLVDDFARFPTRNGTLLQEFYLDRINYCIKITDDAINSWPDHEDGMEDSSESEGDIEDSTADEDADEVVDDGECNLDIEYEDMSAVVAAICEDGPTDYDEDEPDVEEIASKVPESHTWWARRPNIRKS